MALSGSTNYTQTAQDIIRMAFFHIGKYGNGRTLTADDLFIAQNILNAMVKEWMGMGLHLWSKQEGIIFITPYESKYDLGTYTYFAKEEESTTNKNLTTLSSGTTLTITSTADITVADRIGVVLDTGYIFWTTVASITDATTLELTAPLTSQSSAGNLVYTFTETAAKPLRISSARILQGFDGGASGSDLVELPMSRMSYADYWNMSMTTVSAEICNQFAYNPQIDNGEMFIWPRCTTAMNRIRITYERILEDMDSLNNSFDFPSEWYSALQYQLAVRLAPGYGKSDRLPTLLPIASVLLSNVKDWDNENTSLRFMPDYSTQGYD